MKKFFALVLALFMLVGCSKKNDQKVRIYSIIHEEETQALLELFSKQTGYKGTFLRASTGELINRVLSEKDNPQADILLGGASSYHIQLDQEGCLTPYESPNAKAVPSYARAPNNSWTGFCVLSLGIGINTERFHKKFGDTPYPMTWEDLVNPAFKGEIVLTNPVASSTAYLFVQDQLQRLGDEKGWAYLSSLTPLVGQFPDSGSAPAKLIGTGEYAMGVSYIHSLAKYNSDGFDVKVIAPPQSVGDVDCISIMKNTKNLEASKAFVDFMLSRGAQELMSSIDFTVPVNPEAHGAKGSIPIEKLDLIKYDVDKASREREAVLEKWTKIVK